MFTIGTFEGDVPQGLAWQSRSVRMVDGFLYGEVNQDGEFTGDDISFIYPDFLTGLRGTFVGGVLQNASAVDVVAERCNNGVKELRLKPAKYGKGVIWEKEEMVFSHFGKTRQVMDPHERKSVYIGKSTNPNANEGLFARRKFRSNDLVSYYSGHRFVKEENIIQNMTIKETQISMAYSFALGKYAPTWWKYPKNLLLDVPPEFISIVQFRTTLGHKANHKFDNNVEYIAVDHPVLGGIAGLVATADIDVGEEVFAHYRFGNNVAIDWYMEEFRHGVRAPACFERKKSC